MLPRGRGARPQLGQTDRQTSGQEKLQKWLRAMAQGGGSVGSPGLGVATAGRTLQGALPLGLSSELWAHALQEGRNDPGTWPRWDGGWGPCRADGPHLCAGQPGTALGGLGALRVSGKGAGSQGPLSPQLGSGRFPHSRGAGKGLQSPLQHPASAPSWSLGSRQHGPVACAGWQGVGGWASIPGKPKRVLPAPSAPASWCRGPLALVPRCGPARRLHWGRGAAGSPVGRGRQRD